MTTQYRFTGDSPLVFPVLSAEVHAGEPNAGVLDPGEEFASDQDLSHVLLERRKGQAWEPTVTVAAATGLPEKADALVALLADQPELADQVEAAERQRQKPRTTVTEAIARAREKGE